MPYDNTHTNLDSRERPDRAAATARDRVARERTERARQRDMASRRLAQRLLLDGSTRAANKICPARHGVLGPALETSSAGAYRVTLTCRVLDLATNPLGSGAADRRQCPYCPLLF